MSSKDNINELWEIMTMYSFFTCILSGNMLPFFQKKKEESGILIIEDYGPSQVLIPYKSIFGDNKVNAEYSKSAQYEIILPNNRVAVRLNSSGVLVPIYLTEIFFTFNNDTPNAGLKSELVKNLLWALKKLNFIKIDKENKKVYISLILSNEQFKFIFFNVPTDYINTRNINPEYEGETQYAPTIQTSTLVELTQQFYAYVDQVELTSEEKIKITDTLNNWLYEYNFYIQNLHNIVILGSTARKNQKQIREGVLMYRHLFASSFDQLRDSSVPSNVLPANNNNLDNADKTEEIIGYLKIINNSNVIDDGTRQSAENMLTDILNDNTNNDNVIAAIYNIVDELKESTIDKLINNLKSFFNGANLQIIVDVINQKLKIENQKLVLVNNVYIIEIITEEELEEEQIKEGARRKIDGLADGGLLNYLNELLKYNGGFYPDFFSGNAQGPNPAPGINNTPGVSARETAAARGPEVYPFFSQAWLLNKVVYPTMGWISSMFMKNGAVNKPKVASQAIITIFTVYFIYENFCFTLMNMAKSLIYFMSVNAVSMYAYNPVGYLQMAAYTAGIIGLAWVVSEWLLGGPPSLDENKYPDIGDYVAYAPYIALGGAIAVPTLLYATRSVGQTLLAGGSLALGGLAVSDIIYNEKKTAKILEIAGTSAEAIASGINSTANIASGIASVVETGVTTTVPSITEGISELIREGVPTIIEGVKNIPNYIPTRFIFIGIVVIFVSYGVYYGARSVRSVKEVITGEPPTSIKGELNIRTK